MILIADSGSTKTDWAALHNGQVLARVHTRGMNPFFQTPEQMRKEIQETLIPQLPQQPVTAVHFYGAGCTPEKCAEVAQTLTSALEVQGRVDVHSDMVGAARGLCGRHKGIVCIMGTGSNSCLYDGTGVVANVSPLGFILGDEGSGAVLGKLLVADLLKNQLGDELKQEFLDQYKLTPADVIDRVYRQPFPNRFLASLSPFVASHLNHPGIRSMVRDSFVAFLRRNVMQYAGCPELPVHFVGSVAWHYQSLLHEAVQECGLRMGQIMKAPMDGLISYHSQC